MSSPVTRYRVDQVGEAPSSRTLLAERDWIDRLELGNEGDLGVPLRILLEMHRSGDEVFVSGCIEGKITLPCYRCLKPVAAPFAGPFRVAYLPAPADLAGGERRERDAVEPGASREAVAGAIEGDDEDVFYHVNGFFDLIPMLREQLLIALPERALCTEGCRGLCPTCGADLNTSGCDCPADEGFSKFEKLRDLRIR